MTGGDGRAQPDGSALGGRYIIYFVENNLGSVRLRELVNNPIILGISEAANHSMAFYCQHLYWQIHDTASGSPETSSSLPQLCCVLTCATLLQL